MKQLHLRTTTSALALAAILASVTADQPARAADTLAILEAADRSTPSNYAAGVTWEVVVEQWEGKELQATQHLRLHTKGENTLAEFIAPAKVSGRKLLMKDRAMWFSKPGLLKPVPISPRQRLLGAASYGDLVSVNLGRNYKILTTSEESRDGEPCHVFELTAKSKDEVYPRLKAWFSKAKSVGVRNEYYSENGVMLKWATFDFGNQLTVGTESRKFLSRIVIHDPNSTESVAVLKIGRVNVEPVSDATFDLNLLTQ